MGNQRENSIHVHRSSHHHPGQRLMSAAAAEAMRVLPSIHRRISFVVSTRKKRKLGSSTHQTPLPFSSSLRHHKYSIFYFCSRHQKKKREGKKKRGTSQPAER